MSEFEKYIGQPWSAGAEGPDAWDCMAFTAHIQREHFDVEMPRITIPDYDDVRGLVLLNSTHFERENWKKVPTPKNGDLVFVRSPMHYGVWLETNGGGTLHCVRGQGVVWTKDASWVTSGFGTKIYFRNVCKL